ncbi:MAG: hypothetical protein AAF790_02515 [Planctomycetota bacterium]
MPNAQDTPGAVFKNGAAILLARVVGADGQAITASDLSSIRYSVLELDECRPNTSVVVPGPDGVAIAAAPTVFDTRQTDALWTVDAAGYNFRHELDVATNDAFPKAGVAYQVRYEMTPVSGQKVVFRFHLRAV